MDSVGLQQQQSANNPETEPAIHTEIQYIYTPAITIVHSFDAHCLMFVNFKDATVSKF
jgi:hypothetical protein